MRIWTIDALGEAPTRIREGGAAVAGALQRLAVGKYPRLVEVTQGSSRDFDRYAFEIASGLLMQIEHEPDRANFFHEAAERILKATSQGARLSRGASMMADYFGIIVGRAQRIGLPVEMHRLDIAEPDHWSGPDSPAYLAGLRTLGQNLRPSLEWLVIDGRRDLERQFQSSMGDLRVRYDMLSWLCASDADGIIDALALELTLGDPHAATVFRDLQASDRLRLAGGGMLIWDEGRILSAYVSSEGRFGWYDDALYIHGRHIPESLRLHMVGKPPSLLIDLPQLTETMTVIEIVNRRSGDHPYAEVKLELPFYLVNTSEGRQWPK